MVIIGLGRIIPYWFTETHRPFIISKQIEGDKACNDNRDNKFICYESLPMFFIGYETVESPFMQLWHKLFNKDDGRLRND